MLVHLKTDVVLPSRQTFVLPFSVGAGKTIPIHLKSRRSAGGFSHDLPRFFLATYLLFLIFCLFLPSLSSFRHYGGNTISLPEQVHILSSHIWLSTEFSWKKVGFYLVLHVNSLLVKGFTKLPLGWPLLAGSLEGTTYTFVS